MDASDTTIQSLTLEDSRPVLILGLGESGWSMLRFLRGRDIACVVNDSRDVPPRLEACAAKFPDVPVHCGGFDPALLSQVSAVAVSPGIAMHDSMLVAAREAGLSVVGDIELFTHAANAPVIGITGSNGKSTVTTWFAQLLSELGRHVRVGGNLGTPALDLLATPAPDYYVLELSSFQLERAPSLSLAAAVVLNISPDHMTEHGGMQAYVQAKSMIYRATEAAVMNRDDPVVVTMPQPSAKRVVSFGLTDPDAGQLGISLHRQQAYFSLGGQHLMPVDCLAQPADHQNANALACLALLHALGEDVHGASKCLSQLRPLAHRFESIATINNVTFINDSKATNVGAAATALQSMASACVLIAGGDAKGMDIEPLVRVIQKKARAVVLIGKDADLFKQQLGSDMAVMDADSMQAAVASAYALAQPGDTVLLAPACASLDMFKNYIDRGQQFSDAVRALAA